MPGLLSAWVAAHLAVTEAGAAPAISLRCGVVVEQDDFTKSDSHGDLSLLGSGMCQAVAAAQSTRAAITGYPDEQHGLTALREHRIDLLLGGTPDRATAVRLGVVYAAPIFNDGQGFLVRRSLHVGTVSDLRDKVICYISETPMDVGLVDGMARRGIGFRPHPFEETGEMGAALVGGSCDAVTADISALAVMRGFFHRQADAFVILPETIRDDPFAPVLRAQDTGLAHSVLLVEEMLQAASQAGVTKQDALAAPVTTQLRRLSDDLAIQDGQSGFPPGWIRRVLALVGNRQELLRHTLGTTIPN